MATNAETPKVVAASHVHMCRIRTLLWFALPDASVFRLAGRRLPVQGGGTRYRRGAGTLSLVNLATYRGLMQAQEWS
jgi:hypothetical protein